MRRERPRARGGRRRLSVLAISLGLALGLSSCGGFQDGSLFSGDLFRSSPFSGAPQNSAEIGLAELAKGNYPAAENHFSMALKQDPKNPYALLGAGLLYQYTGQPTRARSMFEALIAIRPDAGHRMVVWSDPQPRPISEIASVNLALLDSGNLASTMGRGPMGGDSGLGAAGAMPSMPSSPSMVGPQRGGEDTITPGALAEADLNRISRFDTLKLLLDQGLITPDEYKTRRTANVGALLPLSSPPAATGLDRPLPPAEQIAARLRAIGRALEMRAMTVSQHSAERTMILDALMPEAPVRVENPAPPPRGLMEAADQVRRIEFLRSKGLISSDEYTKERAAIEAGMQAAPRAAAPATGGDGGPVALASASGTPQPAVHLASYSSRTTANRGWTQIRRAHQDMLGDLRPAIDEVNIPGKGTFFRLKAGPLTSAAAAASLCARLKQRGQYCDPTTMGGA